MRIFIQQIRPVFLLKILLIIAALALPAVYLMAIRWPFFIDHVLRSMLLNMSSSAILDGDLYPRWLMAANSGLGSPAMIFQPILSFYLALPLEWLKESDRFGLWRLLSINICYVFIGGCGYYYWLREHFGNRRAEYGAILFLISPGLFGSLLHGNSAGLCTAAIIPWLLLSAKKTADNPARNAVFYALAQALLVLSHLPTTLVFSVIPPLYALVYSEKEKRLKTMVYLICGGLVGVAIASIYWLPIFMNKEFIWYDSFNSGFLNYNVHFPRIVKHPIMYAQFYFPGMAGICYLLIPFIFCCFAVRGKNPFAEQRRLIIFFLAIYAAGLFMIFPISRFLWDNLAILKDLQASGRFSILLWIAVIFIATCWLDKIGNHNLFYTLAITMCIMIFLLNSNYWYTARLSGYWNNVYANRLIPQNPHMTIWMRNAGIHDSMNPPRRFLNVAPSRVVSGEAEIADIIQDTRSISFKARVTSPEALVTLKRYYYPGWIAPEGMEKAITIREYDALLAVNLPQGEYEVTIKQPWFPGEKLGLIISACGLSILLIWTYIARRKRAAT